jgi:histidinol dehydrogenase
LHARGRRFARTGGAPQTALSLLRTHTRTSIQHTQPKTNPTKIQKVEPIVAEVRAEGDAAVRRYTSKFDRVELDSVCVRVEDLPPPQLPDDVTAAFDVAYANIAAFHRAQRANEAAVETMPGVTCRRVTRPIGAVGLYVPGGTAVLPSSALMLAVPAQIAGCATVVLATPPRPDGSITPEVLYCARKAGVTHILKAGGAQAVAAMAWGTGTVPKVDKLFGPGNQYVTAAKMLLTNSEAMVAIDMPAGPSEVLVIADAGAPPAHVAADLLSQAEHGPDSQVVLLALPGLDVAAVQAAVSAQCDALPRADVARRALGNSCVVRVASRDEAIEISNAYAPEHLIVNVNDADAWLPRLDNAGSVFLGRWTPESVGDYASGTNHVLPTYGYARMYSGVSLDSFTKRMTVQSLTYEGLQALGPSVAKMAEVEGLEAHRRAVTLRLGMS